MFPSADIIAVAIVAAARALVPPDKVAKISEHIARGWKDAGARSEYADGFPLARSRCYAGVALWDAFPDVRRSRIGVKLGQSTADLWAQKLEKDLKAGRVKWWNDDVECAVRDAVERAMGPVDVPSFIGANEIPAPMSASAR